MKRENGQRKEVNWSAHDNEPLLIVAEARKGLGLPWLRHELRARIRSLLYNIRGEQQGD